jgi:hypothetical protein
MKVEKRDYVFIVTTSKGHKCSEKKLFYIDCEEEEDQEWGPPSQDIDLEDTAPTISSHALVDISTP